MARTEQQRQAAVDHLRRRDPVLREVMDVVGPCQLRPRRDRFAMLVRSIISQQISVSAAASIRKRLEQLLEPDGVTPQGLLRLDATRLRTAGVSPQKAGYMLDLAAKVDGGAVQLSTMGRRGDEEVIQELTQVKGIGRWTAEMFLMFSLGRPDVLPCGDLGLRNALKNLYGLSELPTRSTCEEIAAAWRPYATVASWYCWRSLELPTANESDGQ